MQTKRLLADVETGGLNVEDGVVEVGFIVLDEHANIIDRFESLVDPGTGFICPSASAIHDITLDMVADKPTLDEIFSADDPSCYGKPIEADRIIFCAHKSGFDRKFLAPYLRGEVLEVDSLRWARSLWPDSPNHTLACLKYALNLPKDTGPAHRVMSDILQTHALLRLIMQTLNVTLDELAEMSKEPMLLRRYPMGKHKGEPFADVPKSYLRWADNNLTDIDMDLAHSIKHYLSIR